MLAYLGRYTGSKLGMRLILIRTSVSDPMIGLTAGHATPPPKLESSASVSPNDKVHVIKVCLGPCINKQLPPSGDEMRVQRVHTIINTS